MKVLMINSPIYMNKRDVNEEYLPPIGLGYIATYLKENNINVELVDCVYERLGVKEILKVIELKKPDYIGINVFTPNMIIVKEIIEGCKIETSFIVGGQVTKFIYNDIIQWNTKNEINVVIGEGEYVIADIVKAKAMGKIFIEKYNRKVYCIDKDSLYYPKDISLLNLDRSFFIDREIINIYEQNEAAIVTSRGCIYNCAFCGGAKSLNYNITIRERSKISIIDEINDILKRNPKVNSIRILDDLFLRNRINIEKAIDIFEGFENVSWRAMAHILSFKESEHLLTRLRKSGCKELFIGIESGSERIRKSINKLGTIDQIINTVYKILDAGINVKGYFIYGFPEENIEDFNKTYELAKKLKNFSYELSGNFRCSVFQFRPYHGTELYSKIMGKYGKIEEFNLNNDINKFSKRTQFNYDCGNYSECTSEEISQYIIKTLEINNGE